MNSEWVLLADMQGKYLRHVPCGTVSQVVQETTVQFCPRCNPKEWAEAAKRTHAKGSQK